VRRPAKALSLSGGGNGLVADALRPREAIQALSGFGRLLTKRRKTARRP